MEKELREAKPEVFGIDRRDLTNNILKDIYEIYGDVTGVYPLKGHACYLDTIDETLDRRMDVEFRYGSRIDGHSKFWIKRARGSENQPLLRFAFSANLDPRDRNTKLGAEGRRMEVEFQEYVNRYLQEHGLAQRVAF